MKADYVNPFYLAAHDVFETMLDLQPERGELKIIEDLVSGGDANVIIGLTGNLSGTIIYSFPKEMALGIVKSMSGMEMEQLDSFVTSALGEMANIISGNAVTYLNDANYDCDIVPPQIIIGVNKSVSMATQRAMVLPLKTEMGALDINISIIENKG